MSLGKNFIDVAEDILNNEAIYDPVYEVSPDNPGELIIPITESEEQLDIFVLWLTQNPNAIVTSIKPPVGDCLITESSTDSGLQLVNGSHYDIARFTLPFKCGEQLAHAGDWTVKMSHGEDRTKKPETVTALSYAKTDIDLDAETEIEQPVFGCDRLAFRASIIGSKDDIIKDIKYKASYTLPLPRPKNPEDEDNTDPKVNSNIAASTAKLAEISKPIMLDVKDNGMAVIPCLEQAGLYQFHLIAEAVDQNGNQIRREEQISTYYAGPNKLIKNLLILLLAIIILFLVWLFRKSGKQ